MDKNHPLNHPRIHDGRELEIPENFISDLLSRLFSLSEPKNISEERKKMYRHGSISAYIKNYKDTKLSEEYELLFADIKGKTIGISRSSISRAETGKSGTKSAPIKYQLLDLMSSAAWGTCLAKIILQDKYNVDGFKYMVTIPEYAKNQLFEEIQQNRSSTNEPIRTLQNEEHTIFNNQHILRLSKAFWDNLKIKDKKERLDAVARYFTHTDSSLISLVVAQDECIIEPKNNFLVRDRDGFKEDKSIAQVFDLAASQSFSLIKILSEGGIGKSTFLYWIAKKYCESYVFFFIDRLTNLVIYDLIEIIKVYPNPRQTPYAIIIDNVASPEIRTLIEYLIKEIKSKIEIPVVFILAERESRYNIHFENNKLDRQFGDNVQTIIYSAPEKKEIFKSLYGYLKRKNPQLNSEELEKNTQELFLNNSIDSLSEGIFAVIQHLKLKNKIDYIFDWEDWDAFIENNKKFHSLRGLFTVVSCFYQFGIKVPVTFESSFLKNKDKIIILEALASFPANTNPIIMDVDEKNTYLGLKHEFLALWYLKTSKGKLLAEAFIRDFIKDINNETSAKLFRKLRKTMGIDEYHKSYLFQFLNPNIALEITNRYLEIPSLSEDERRKMLMEKGMIYLLLEDREEEAINSFKVAASSSNSNHPLDQLAKIYSKRENTLHMALQTYLKILHNKGYYAILHIYKLSRKLGQKNIILKDETGEPFSVSSIISLAKQLPDYLQRELVRELILSDELNFARVLLETMLTSSSNPNAKDYNSFAHFLPLKDATIEWKILCFKVAMRLSGTLLNNRSSILYALDYSVFMFQIGSFGKSEKVLSELQKKLTPFEFKEIKKELEERIKSLGKLHFRNLPENPDRLQNYLISKCNNARLLLKSEKVSNEIILQCDLVLHTVRYNSKSMFPDIYFEATKLLAFSYAKFYNRNWNNLSPHENMILADNLYSQLLEARVMLENIELIRMQKNLLRFNQKDKLIKALKINDSSFSNISPNDHSLIGELKRIRKKILKALSE